MIAQPDMFPEVQLTPEDDTDSRYTPRPFVLELERKQGFKFTLDVAACAESHHAPRYYTKADNGLVQPWEGDVWCNPPFSDIAPWVIRSWEQMLAGATNSVTMLVPCWTDRRWWKEQVEPFRDHHWFDRAEHVDRRLSRKVRLTTENIGRITFGFPGNPDAVGRKGQAEFWCVLLRWRR